ncbi:MGDG synthase family glycosyltransferase [Viridibacillus sp. NPDC096237]|uniref:MGDG synthase family glycosyltransferase n=1 Tax=Viridibacillus sp. NPDC096237 TaxID=3390721 RepID=UPI003D0398A5
MKILILNARFGMGHYSVSKALEQEIKEYDINAEVQLIDIFDYCLPRNSKKIYGSYNYFINKGANIYNAYYHYTNNRKSNIKIPFQHYFIKKTGQLINNEKPDLIISTFPICSLLVSEYKKISDDNILLLTCITDISGHKDWYHKNTDFYFAASSTTKAEIINRGVLPEQVFISGIPVKKQFKVKRDIQKRNSCNEYLVNKSRNILLMGGGLGMLPDDEAFYKRLNMLENVKVTIITGTNKKIHRNLYGKFDHIDVISYTEQVDQYMKEADLIITKPGGITLFESIASELPILVFQPFLAQEIHNADFIERNKIGKVVEKKLEDSLEEIFNLLSDESFLENCRGNMRNIQNEIETTTIKNLLSTLEEKLFDNGQTQLIGSRKYVQQDLIHRKEGTAL